MAKRVVQECDLTKQEYDPAETVTLIIKRSGKKTGRTYELSPDAAAKLETQLVSGQKLDANWTFLTNMMEFKSGETKRTLGDLDEKTEDANFIASKKQELKDEGVDLSPRELEDDTETVLPDLSDGTKCLHMNKGPIQTTMKQGERYIYRICRECRSRISEKSKDDRNSFMNGKAPAESRVNNHPLAKEGK